MTSDFDVSKVLCLVVPCFNESDSISLFFQSVQKIQMPLVERGVSLKILFVDDGSTDQTLLEIERHALLRKIPSEVIELSRNFGKEAALTAGLDKVVADAVIPIDVDLQDPPEVVIQLVDVWLSTGCDIVNAVRADRRSDGFLKRFSAQGFYKVHNRISKEKIPYNVGDFRLLSVQVVRELRSLREGNRLLKGLIPWLGFHTESILYSRTPRSAGKAKMSPSKLISLAGDGLLGSSLVPLRASLLLGLFGVLINLSFLAVVLVQSLIGESAPSGYISLLSALSLFGSVLLVMVGVLGEYVGRIFQQIKQRPLYIIKSSKSLVEDSF